MQPTQHTPHRRIAIAAAIGLVAMIVVAGAIYAVVRLSSEKKAVEPAESQGAAATSQGDKQVTKQTLEQGMNELDDTIQDSKQVHAETKSVVDQMSKQTKGSDK